MITVIISFIISIILLIYVLQMIHYAVRLPSCTPSERRISDPPLNEGVTLVVPFRDESASLPVLINDMVRLEEPSVPFEILLVNDHSSDGSSGLARQLTRKIGHCRVLDLPPGMSGKKHAVLFAVRHASFERILQTDADCRIPPGLVGLHVHTATQQESSLVAGPVVVRSRGSLWNRVEALEFLSLGAVTGAGFRTGSPVMCNGANLSYPRSLLIDNADRYLNHDTPSGDDMFLLEMAKGQATPAAFIFDRGAMVVTEPAGSFTAFMRQRIRWGSKARFYRDRAMQFLALLVFGSNLSILAFLILALTGSASWYVFAAAWCIKALADFLIVGRWAGCCGQQKLLLLFLPVALFYYFYIVLTGILSLFAGYTWKGRTYK